MSTDKVAEAPAASSKFLNNCVIFKVIPDLWPKMNGLTSRTCLIDLESDDFANPKHRKTWSNKNVEPHIFSRRFRFVFLKLECEYTWYIPLRIGLSSATSISLEL